MRILPLGIIIGALSLAGCGDDPQVERAGVAAALAKTVAAGQDHVTVAELSDWIIRDQRDFELIDIREQDEFGEGHIAGARHVPLAALLSETSMAALPAGRKVVVYSNGTAHAAQAALLLRLVDRDAYALLGGFNHWRAYLGDPAAAGVAEMDAAQRARYQAVACYFQGDYLAGAGLVPQAAAPATGPAPVPAAAADPLGLGLGLGLGSEQVRDNAPPPPAADPLGLGLGLGLGGEAAKSLAGGAPSASPPASGRLLIKAEC